MKMNKEQQWHHNRIALIHAWEVHCEKTHFEQDNLKYDMNIGQTYIQCCVIGCKWKKDSKKFLKSIEERKI